MSATTDLTATESKTALVTDYWEWDRLVQANGWSDGLPVAPPTDDRVQAIIDYLGRPPLDEVAIVAPVNGVATIEQIAIQCAMAGCRPEYAPVVIAAVEAMADPVFNLHGVQSTTNPCAPLAIVNGPIVEELGFNVGNGAFSGGGHANVAIGRAIRLIMWNIGGGKPSVNDMSPLGQPAKFSFCVGENMAQNPWEPMHTSYGYGPEDNAVAMFACSGPFPAMVNGSPERILGQLAAGMAVPTVMSYHAAGQALVVLSIRPALELAKAGYSRQDVRRYLYEHARYRVGELRARGAMTGPLSDTSMVYWGQQSLRDVRPPIETMPDEALVPMVRSEEDIIVMVTGGDSQWWAAYCQGWGAYGGHLTTRPIQLPPAAATA
jgi:hypothetical protein